MCFKKPLFCLYFLVLSHWSYCQEVEKGAQSIKFDYGILSLYELGAFADKMNMANQAASESIEHISGPISIIYSYYISRGIALGIAVRYEWGMGSLYDISKNYQTPEYYNGSFKDNLFTAGPEMQIIYTNHYKYQCYGGINASLTYRYRTTERYGTLNKWIPTGQVTFWGCQFGEGHLKGYIEIGMGYRGLVNGGVGYFFH
ncbi:MAG: hypothetical protein JSS96_16615 [Bacteroidetes bacterium]|nr:hypothetical protein [Bacteroidota bacterium]